jgi:hypothetical protein
MIKTLNPRDGSTKPLLPDQVSGMTTSKGLVYYIPKATPRKIISFDLNSEEKMDVMEMDEPVSAVQITVAGWFILIYVAFTAIAVY